MQTSFGVVWKMTNRNMVYVSPADVLTIHYYLHSQIGTNYQIRTNIKTKTSAAFWSLPVVTSRQAILFMWIASNTNQNPGPSEQHAVFSFRDGHNIAKLERSTKSFHWSQ